MGKSAKKRKRQRLVASEQGQELPPGLRPNATREAAPQAAVIESGCGTLIENLPSSQRSRADVPYVPKPITEDLLGGISPEDLTATVRTLQVGNAADPLLDFSTLHADPRMPVRKAGQCTVCSWCCTQSRHVSQSSSPLRPCRHRGMQVLAVRPDVFRSKPLKALRTALHTLTSSKALEATGKSPVGRVSDALRDERWEDALAALQAMRSSGAVPKLGALCRWVRDCDARGMQDPMVCTVLDAMLRTADPGQALLAGNAADQQQLSGVTRHPPFQAREGSGVSCGAGAAAASEGQEEQQRKEEEGNGGGVASRFRVILHKAAADRQPPNKHDLRIHTNEPGAVRLSEGLRTGRRDVPGVPGAFVLTELLSGSECQQILRAAEGVGYGPDEPATGSKSILAHAFVWLADEALCGAVYERCRALLPQRLGGGEVKGINARWRVYRYEPGAVYRPHIDGAWPGSGLSGRGSAAGSEGRNGTESSEEYVYDAFGDRWSRLTFLIYLNSQAPEGNEAAAPSSEGGEGEDEPRTRRSARIGSGGFEGGCTTFFLPGPRVGWLDAKGVVPQAGCALVFPHGDAKGSLLHEGSAVTRGAKYVVRTEVLYSTAPGSNGCRHQEPTAEASAAAGR